MDIIVASRHGQTSERIVELVQERFRSLDRFESRVSRVEVTLAEEKNRWEVEALASVDRADPVHAHGEARDVRSALDQAVDRMARQLKRLRERHRDHQGRGKDELTPAEGAGEP
ncbi:MAG TPA: ribosome-associated translation inhibitor RaiA [Gemmatimonadota bacterium]|nr:ribosome-associated translation inhibitor RaiA [Gemmatimonadota bacterium]